MKPQTQLHAVGIAITIAGILLLLHMLISLQHELTSLPYSEFQSLLRGGQISEVEVDGQALRGRLKEPRNGDDHFTVYRVDLPLADALDSAGVTYRARAQSGGLSTALSWVLPPVIAAVQLPDAQRDAA